MDVPDKVGKSGWAGVFSAKRAGGGNGPAPAGWPARTLWPALACALGVAVGAAEAGDVEGAKDHPLFGRYQGASIVYYKAVEYDEYALLQAPHDYAALLDRDELDDRSGSDWWRGEGRLTRIRYEVPAGVSSLEVVRNYENALKGKGFEVLFSCADRTCFEGRLKDPYLLGQQIDADNDLSTRYFDHARYMLVRLDEPQGPVHAGVLVGENGDNASAFLAVLETRPMDDGKIALIDAGKMRQAIETAGKVDVYGIHFDFDRDTLQPGSKPTLDEIAGLLRQNPQLRLEIIGHTDNRGAQDYNMDLSRRRAANVVAALVRDYSIATGRLTSSGAGFGMPVASNDTEEGRARNRRVELSAR